jgi:Uncharacterised protein family (UPF0158)
MAIPVSLRDVVEEMETFSDEITGYINRKTGELVSIGPDEARMVEDDEPTDDLPDWQRELLPKVREVLDSDDFIPLPTRFEIHEWAIMERFAIERPDLDQGDALLHAIRGAGAFRRFKDRVDDLGLREEWFRFRDRALEEIAIRFLDANEIPYVR